MLDDPEEITREYIPEEDHSNEGNDDPIETDRDPSISDEDRESIDESVNTVNTNNLLSSVEVSQPEVTTESSDDKDQSDSPRQEEEIKR